MLTRTRAYARFAGGLRRFLEHPITLGEARAALERRLACREANFLRLAGHAIFRHASSPYRALLRRARCEQGDLRAMVQTHGLESALARLRAEGVYVTYQEFRGLTPIVRGGEVIPTRARDFDNPQLRRYYETRSSGTTGAGARVMTDLEHLDVRASQQMIAEDAYGVVDAPAAIWFGTLPDVGLTAALTRARYGRPPERWFTHVLPGALRPSLVPRLATEYTWAMGRLTGVRIPRPEPLALERASVVARWAAAAVRRSGRSLVRTQVSRALRVCLAARDEGLDLTGVTLTGGGEPPTPGKVREIEATGARWFPGYYATEPDTIGLGCSRPLDGTDVHLLTDHLAVIQTPRRVPGWDLEVDAFCFTTLLPTAPKILLNTESDDYGLVESRSCGCPLEALGLTAHLREIRSFGKLTGEGVTLVGTDMLRILDEVLPAKFGGSALDYQVMEEEDERGLTRLYLVVSPRVRLPSEDEAIATLLEALRHGSNAADLARAVWQQAGAWRVKRVEPIWTSRGKLMPLHLPARGRARTQKSADPPPPPN